ncbi:MAG: major capsid protein P2 [Gammaproteobacteria bacterium]
MFIKLKAFQNVVANGTASLSTTELDGYSLHSLRFQLGGTFTKAQMTRIEVKINGKDLCNQITGTQVQAINTWKNIGVAGATDLSLYFGCPESQTFHGMFVTDVDFSVIKAAGGGAATVEIQVDIGAATSPTLVVYAEVYQPKALMGIFQPNEYGIVKALPRTLLTPAAAVTLYAQDVGYGSHAGAGIINEFWFHANLTALQIKKNGVVIWDNIAITQMNDWQLEQDHNLTAGMYVWSPTNNRWIGQLEPTLMPDGVTPYPFQHLLTTSASDVISVFAEIATQMAYL